MDIHSNVRACQDWLSGKNVLCGNGEERGTKICLFHIMQWCFLWFICVVVVAVLVMVTGQICGKIAPWLKVHVKGTVQDTTGFLCLHDLRSQDSEVTRLPARIIFHFSLSLVSQPPSSVLHLFILVLPPQPTTSVDIPWILST